MFLFNMFGFRSVMIPVIFWVMTGFLLADSPLDGPIEWAVRYLIEHCDEQGRFTYIARPASSDRLNQYSLVRHAGVLYALSDSYHWAHATGREDLAREIQKTLFRAARLMRQRIGPVSGPIAGGTLALWEPIDKIYSEQDYSQGPTAGNETAKLGGAGLALVALAELETLEPGFSQINDLVLIAEFLSRMTLSDGSTLASLNAQGQIHRLAAIYYPGEAALGLCRLHRSGVSGPWLDLAEKQLLYLAQADLGRDPETIDQWPPIAIWELTQQKKCSEENKAKLLDYAQRIAQSMIEEQIVDTDQEALLGAFDEEGSLCAVSARLEGLAAFLKLEETYRPDSSQQQETRDAIERGIKLLLKYQIQEGPFRGGIPYSGLKRHAAHDEIRIDYVQHFLSALLGNRERVTRNGQ